MGKQHLSYKDICVKQAVNYFSMNLFPSCMSARNAMGINTVLPSLTCLWKATAKLITTAKSVLSEKGVNLLKTPVQKAACFIPLNAPQLMNVRLGANGFHHFRQQPVALKARVRGRHGEIEYQGCL